ncbi:MAG: hypothetical protein HZB85_05915 [Deltaproteobacteria bacterium]|nr:hypothetical protein [Deltaproteobacteria bacterium]
MTNLKPDESDRDIVMKHLKLTLIKNTGNVCFVDKQGKRYALLFDSKDFKRLERIDDLCNYEIILARSYHDRITIRRGTLGKSLEYTKALKKQKVME